MNINNLSAMAKILIRRSPVEVFTAFAEARMMSKFWFTRRDNGLKENEYSTWYLGPGEDAPSFDVLVKEIESPHKIVIEWENGGEYSQVTWSIDETEEGHSLLAIEETGFTGDSEAILERVIDSTGGFNQVVVAAKAVIENGAELNVVNDHA